MKRKLLIVVSIFAMGLVSAQKYGQKYKPKSSRTTNVQNKQVGATVSENEDWEEAKKFADKLADASKKYTFLQKKESTDSDILVLRYIPSSIAKKKELYLNKNCKECMEIEFKKSREGKYEFNHIWGDFSDLFPIWKGVFDPNAQMSKYKVSDENVLVEWKITYGKDQFTFGRLGVAWFIKK